MTQNDAIKMHKCAYCNYETKRKYDLNRHQNAKHIINIKNHNEKIQNVQNDIPKVQNDIPNVQNDIPCVQNDIPRILFSTSLNIYVFMKLLKFIFSTDSKNKIKLENRFGKEGKNKGKKRHFLKTLGRWGGREGPNDAVNSNSWSGF